MSAPTDVTEAEQQAAEAAEAVSLAKARLAKTGRGVTATALHKLRDAFRHADLTAQGLRQRAEEDRQKVRLAGLEEIGQQVDTLAASAATGRPTPRCGRSP